MEELEKQLRSEIAQSDFLRNELDAALKNNEILQTERRSILEASKVFI